MNDIYLEQFTGWIRFPSRGVAGSWTFKGEEIHSLKWHPRGGINGENNLLITGYEEDEEEGIAKLIYSQILWRSRRRTGQKRIVQASSEPSVMYVRMHFDYQVKNPKLIMRQSLKDVFE